MLTGKLPEAFVLRRIVSFSLPGLRRGGGLFRCFGLHASLSGSPMNGSNTMKLRELPYTAEAIALGLHRAPRASAVRAISDLQPQAALRVEDATRDRQSPFPSSSELAPVPSAAHRRRNIPSPLRAHRTGYK
jgi:hypothetical protein